MPTEDRFFKDQPPKVAKSIGVNATWVIFENIQKAYLHCQSGAFVYESATLQFGSLKVIGE